MLIVEKTRGFKIVARLVRLRISLANMVCQKWGNKLLREIGANEKYPTTATKFVRPVFLLTK